MEPGAVVLKAIGTLQNYVTGCEEKFKSVTDSVQALEKNIIQLMKTKLDVIFFLGPVGEGKLPELVIANDGLVLWLRKKNLINTYPSGLAYLSWINLFIKANPDTNLTRLNPGTAGDE